MRLFEQLQFELHDGILYFVYACASCRPTEKVSVFWYVQNLSFLYDYGAMSLFWLLL
jgi:hypothetical protein